MPRQLLLLVLACKRRCFNVGAAAGGFGPSAADGGPAVGATVGAGATGGAELEDGGEPATALGPTKDAGAAGGGPATAGAKGGKTGGGPRWPKG